MSQRARSAKTFIAGAAIERYRRVKLSGANEDTVIKALQADADAYIGVAQRDVDAAGDYIAVDLKTSGETVKCVANNAIAVNANFYAGDDGKISSTAVGAVIGTALEASTADNDVIEVILKDASAGIV